MKRGIAGAMGVLGLSVALVASLLLGVAQAPGTAGQNAGGTYGGPRPSGIFGSLGDFPDSPGVGVVDKQFCTDGTAFGDNVRVNCDSTIFPHNEMSVAVDPRNPNHIVGGSNDYELFPVGATIVERIIAGYYTSFDGGRSWTNGHVPPGGFTFTGDPSVAFNSRFKLVHFGVVAFQAGQGGGFADASVQVSTSGDGGRTFGQPVVVALGTGGTRVTLFNDKPYIAVDNNPGSPFFGRLYVTWTRFLFGPFGNYIESPIFIAFSDDGGRTFSAPQEISGRSAALCSHPFNPSNAGRCSEDQFSSPVVGPDGTLYVAFENDEFQGSPEFRDQYLVVRSTDGGVTFGGPSQAVFPIFDGVDDYPVNIDGRQTLTNSQFRVNSAGNLAVDPASGPGPSATRLYIAFSDNRNGGLTGDLHTVTTNTDIFVVRSDDGGSTWSGPNPVLAGASARNDQFFPWADVDGSGRLRVAFSDRSYDPQDIQYGETLAASPDGVSFTAARVDTGLSNPNDSRWFTAGGRTGGKATFIGDYNGLATGSDGVAHPLWTDMRVSAFPTPPPGRGHNTEDAFTAAVP